MEPREESNSFNCKLIEFNQARLYSLNLQDTEIVLYNKTKKNRRTKQKKNQKICGCATFFFVSSTTFLSYT